tara:strand:+ start:642 stop:3047 length:2406 start_codon:yes stop_codon:yes gene_type:complete
MAESVHTNFPSQVVSDLEKSTMEYGLKVANAIENEWFKGSHSNRYLHNENRFHNLRLYARGEQSIQKYKDELSINGDLSYLNLDWTPVPIIPKFVDIVVNGMAQRTFDVKCFSQDQYGVSKRTEYMETIMDDMRAKEFNEAAKNTMNMDLYKTDPTKLPETKEELELHMSLTYKQEVELANEQAINLLLEGSKFDLIQQRLLRDLTVLGIGAVKTNFNYSEGATVEYVDPANLVYSHTDSPYFDDCYYVGEIKCIPINELVRQFPELTQEELERINKTAKRTNSRYTNYGQNDKNKVQVLYFNYKTYTNDTYKVKTTGYGGKKAIEKEDTFKPSGKGDYERVSRAYEVLYEGAKILGTDRIIKWCKCENMMRTKSDFNKVKMNYSIVAPRMYNGKIESLVSRITGFADMIQLTHLKLQQVLSRMVPDGVYLDADGLAEIDLGNGTNYNPQEALNMFFQTGSILGRSFTGEGDANPGKIPIQEISNGQGAGGKMQALISNYNYYLQMIRDVTGLNEATDASMPDERTLVGVQKLAAANSNTATRHILNASLFVTAETCEALSLRISDILEYSPTRDAFIQAIGAHNVATLKELQELYLYDFGIFIELKPDAEEKATLENNIQMAIQQKMIDLDDAIDLREVKSIKMANQLLKLKRKKKAERDQKMQQENAKAQAEAQSQAQQAASQAEVQKQQQLTSTQMEMEKTKNALKIEYMKQEAMLKRELMDHEFEINMKLRKMDAENQRQKANDAENRKDQRTKIQASQQSQLIDQRKNETEPKNFESAGNDNMGSGGIGIGGLTSN